MNIKEAKEQIKCAMKAYFSKDEYGDYIIPVEKQRPVFLMGPPGIGKTAIMEQIAADLEVGLVSYSMTHHTRQSALGLPYIEKKVYGGKEYSVSEYTMSEIIASVYEHMEVTGFQEGILFLDEINCVSETLAPSMLQFLQYKTFGRHAVPRGWIVVTAGNPPEYNDSVREFDIVTWDRLKRIDVEPNYDVWKEYAIDAGVHSAILTYLEINKDDFYLVENTIDGKTFVTARGWSDLSSMILLYEKNNFAINLELVEQYLQNHRIARDFSIYYDLWVKYASDYQIDKIFRGEEDEKIIERARSAKFDERLTLLGLVLDSLRSNAETAYKTESGLMDLMGSLQMLRVCPSDKTMTTLADLLHKKKDELAKAKTIGFSERVPALNYSFKALREIEELLLREKNVKEPFAIVKKDFDNRVAGLEKEAEKIRKMLRNAFSFFEKSFDPDGQEILVFVTELTASKSTAWFISRYGCDEYFKHNKELLFFKRQRELIREIVSLDLD